MTLEIGNFAALKFPANAGSQAPSRAARSENIASSSDKQSGLDRVSFSKTARVARELLGVTFALHLRRPKIDAGQSETRALISGLKVIHVDVWRLVGEVSGLPGHRVAFGVLVPGSPMARAMDIREKCWWSAAAGNAIFAYGPSVNVLDGEVSSFIPPEVFR